MKRRPRGSSPVACLGRRRTSAYVWITCDAWWAPLGGLGRVGGLYSPSVVLMAQGHPREQGQGPLGSPAHVLNLSGQVV